ncbi:MULTISPECIES: streptolysin S family bacteriocin [Streptomyces]|uniref:streptolysin S family bacteriocin n=1 Tax=Streptomyces TaxID=1883 RepID=UPI0015CF2451|nr:MULTISPECIES: streptolysin S family bacteriocin [Streptomyces]QYA97678.1 streptolysin S family bacteriocin [Streptomyces anulatus]WSV78474.1 streptolysin S family bacteriocin [Streptomyces anulatus]
MADFRMGNLTIRIESEALPQGVLLEGRRFAGNPEVLGSDDSSGGPGGGCGCTCSCTCTCTCTSTSGGAHLDEQLVRLEEVELTVLRESLRSALSDVEEMGNRQKR